ncbi:hypothetical protein BKA64DRAFT_676649 [Cadophora sp. MPI-SDFR-AT-0126]|nr:hypothetical protein BKA64DRAFT_676649 [Leotiomycetes sp. MPI-SDFR-AT-0126]
MHNAPKSTILAASSGFDRKMPPRIVYDSCLTVIGGSRVGSGIVSTSDVDCDTGYLGLLLDTTACLSGGCLIRQIQRSPSFCLRRAALRDTSLLLGGPSVAVSNSVPILHADITLWPLSSSECYGQSHVLGRCFVRNHVLQVGNFDRVPERIHGLLHTPEISSHISVDLSLPGWKSYASRNRSKIWIWTFSFPRLVQPLQFDQWKVS